VDASRRAVGDEDDESGRSMPSAKEGMIPTTQPDTRLELAYDAAQKYLAVQDTTLGNVRTRANTLLATAALFTTFSAGVGLIHTDSSKGAELSAIKGLILLLTVVVLGVCVIIVLWPISGWVFAPSAEKIMERYNQGEDEAAIRMYVITKMNEGIQANRISLGKKISAFKWAVFLLIFEVLLLVVFLTIWK
jgi:hypothetical protein